MPASGGRADIKTVIQLRSRLTLGGHALALRACPLNTSSGVWIKAFHFWQRLLATGVDEIAGPRSCCFGRHCGRTRTSFRYARFLVAGLTSRLFSVIAVLLAMLVTHDPGQTSCRPQVSYRDIPRSSDGWVACRQRLHYFA